jgi:hypothetical protein
MNMQQLARALEEKHVASRYYRFGPFGNGLSDDSFLIEELNGAFVVSYIERGCASPIQTFSSEDGACDFLFAELCSTSYIRQWGGDAITG